MGLRCSAANSRFYYLLDVGVKMLHLLPLLLKIIVFSLSLHLTTQITWAPGNLPGTTSCRHSHTYITIKQIISRNENKNATSGNTGTLIEFWSADWLKIKSTACSTCLQLIFIPTCSTFGAGLRVCGPCYLVREGMWRGAAMGTSSFHPWWNGKAKHLSALGNKVWSRAMWASLRCGPKRSIREPGLVALAQSGPDKRQGQGVLIDSWVSLGWALRIVLAGGLTANHWVSTQSKKAQARTHGLDSCLWYWCQKVTASGDK